MAGYAEEHDIKAVLSAAREWRDTSLLNQRSIFTGDSIWSASNLAELDKFFVKSPDDADESFIAKLEKQLTPASPGAKKLAAEMIWVAKLFASDVKGGTKSAEVRRIWAWSGEALSPDHRLLSSDVMIGVGGTGVGFKFHFWKELVYFVQLMQGWATLSALQKEALLHDPWKFGEWSLKAPKGDKRILRHMLCFLLFPDHYERIVSRGHKILIVTAFCTEVGAEPEESETLSPLAIDQRLLEIRKKLEAKWPGKNLDFYYPPLRSHWWPEDEETDTELKTDPILREGAQPRHDIAEAFEAILAGYTEAKKERYSGSHPIAQHFNKLRESMQEVASRVAPHVSVEWSVGKGNWSTVPWVAFLDSRLTTSTLNGVYGVILFKSDMSGFYLTLNQGVTKPFEDLGSEKARELLLNTADDARRRCASLRGVGFALDNRIDLRVEQGLGAKYAVSTIAHKLYSRERIPSDGEFMADVRELLRVYNRYVEQAPLKRPQTASIPLSQIQSEFASALRAAGISFGKMHDTQTRAFIASLATKRLVILTGLSGSGKTQIAIKFGQWLGPSDRWDIVPVRPDWTGPESVLGYEDALQPPINGKRVWQVPRALELILKAASDPDHPYILVLDEMNLAHVERYFADLLSGMESGEACIPNLEKKGDSWYSAPGQARLPVPENLFVIGTVNVDETTYMFSPKVLDRANTIEFRVRHDDLDGDGRKPASCIPADESFGSSFLAIAQDSEWHRKHAPAWANDFKTNLRQVHRLLSDAGFEFGHRVYFEACRFAAIHAQAGDSSLNAALDLQIIQKILPRLHGSRRQLESTLAALTAFCYQPDRTEDLGDVAKLDAAKARLPYSFMKTRRMLGNVRANQFTSFTDS